MQGLGGAAPSPQKGRRRSPKSPGEEKGGSLVRSSRSSVVSARPRKRMRPEPKLERDKREREFFLEMWRSSGTTPVETAERLGIDPSKALAWAREYRNQKGQSLPAFLERALYLASEARSLAEQADLPPMAIVALTQMGGLVPLLEEAWLEALSRAEK